MGAMEIAPMCSVIRLQAAFMPPPHHRGAGLTQAGCIHSVSRGAISRVSRYRRRRQLANAAP